MEPSASSLSEIVVTKTSDLTTPLLFEQSLVGEATPSPVVISFTNTNAVGGIDVYMKLTLDNALITSYSLASGDELPTESISLTFGKITMEFTPLNGDGTKGDPIVKTYDSNTQQSR